MTLDRRELSAPEPQAGAPDHLECLQPDVLELAPARLEPAGLRTGEQPTFGDVERHLRERPGRTGIAVLQALTRALDLGGGRLEVNPDRFGQLEDELVAPGQSAGAERGAKPREE